MIKCVSVFIGLGSSIGNAEELFNSTEKYLSEFGIKIIKKSKNHKFPPFGGVASNEFTNAVWELDISQFSKQFIGNLKQEFSYNKARKLLEILLACETEHGRTREIRWEDRTLDLDILLFGDLKCDTAKLKIPHPEMENRDFVMIPLNEIR